MDPLLKSNSQDVTEMILEIQSPACLLVVSLYAEGASRPT